MLFSLPRDWSRSERPASVVRYTFEDFVGRVAKRKGGPTAGPAIIPIEAVAPGDVQVLAAHEQSRTNVIDLDVLSEFPSVESVVASAAVRAGRELPHIRELLISSSAPLPDSETLRHLTGLETLYAAAAHTSLRLDLDSLPAGQMRKLAANRWTTKSLEPLDRMTGLKKLWLNLFREPLDAVSRMADLEYLRVLGPAKGWARLRECALLEEVELIQVQIANLRRWNTWQRLRILRLGGRGVKSLAGLESCGRLEQLTLLNLPMNDLSPLRDLPHLEALTLRMADEVDLASVAAVPALRSLVIDSSVSDGRLVRLPTVRTLAQASGLEEIVLWETIVEDGNLMPLAELSNLRIVRLGSMIGADVERLRAARPDLEIHYTPPDPKWAALREQVGEVTIQKPGEGLVQWSIFQSLAHELGVATNYDAERRIKGAVKKRDPDLAKRLDWDTEAGAVGIYAEAEADIRAVAEVVNELLKQKPD
jgi:hypothetical protein